MTFENPKRKFLIADLDTGRITGWYNFEQDAAWDCEQRRKATGGR